MQPGSAAPAAPSGSGSGRDGTVRFQDKVALITGASRGIGRAAAIAFAQRGARVAVHYGARRHAADDTLRALSGAGHAAFAADLADPDAPRALVDRVVADMGRLDILVNNAGVYDLHGVTDTAHPEWQAVWQRTLAINLVAPANLIHAAAPHMIRQGGGRIVNVSSRGAFRGEPGAAAYGASKAGLNALGQSMAQALAPHGIAVCTLAPGFVYTDMVRDLLDGPEGDARRAQSPLGRVGTPEEMAAAIVFLASPEAEYLTGCILDANGASYLRT